MSLTGSGKAKESMSTKALADVGKQEWERFKTEFAPEEKEFIGDVREIGSGRESAYLTGRGISEARQNSEPIRKNNLLGVANRSLDSSRAESSIIENSATKSIERKGKGINSAVGLGRNIATGSLGQLRRSSQLDTSKGISEANAQNIREQGLWDTVGTAAGYGIQQNIKKSN